MRVFLVVDLGFGDSGKGLTVDFLVGQLARPLVARFSGGHQIGHTVQRNGFQHTFSNFGAGTLRGCPTYYSEHTTLFPPAALTELEYLRPHAPQLIVHPLAKVATPFDIAWNRICRPFMDNGTCGVGFGPTVERSEGPCKLFAHHLGYRWVAEQKLAAVADYYRDKAEAAGCADAFRDEIGRCDVGQYLDMCQQFMAQVKVEVLERLQREYAEIVFEGSQGLMLDQDHGIYPHVTRGHTTSKNAVQIIRTQLGPVESTEIYYVTRCYQTRHGNGPMSGAGPVDLINIKGETNTTNAYQGAFRTARLDLALIQYALDTDGLYVNGLAPNRNLMVTCCDQLPSFDVQAFAASLKPGFSRVFASYGPEAKDVRLVWNNQG
jgi:adenylosuccinate synthase